MSTNSRILKLAAVAARAADRAFASTTGPLSMTQGYVLEGRKKLAASRLLAALGCAAEAEELARQSDPLLAQRAASRTWSLLRRAGATELKQNAAAEAARERAMSLSLLARSGRTGIGARKDAEAHADAKHAEVLAKRSAYYLEPKAAGVAR